LNQLKQDTPESTTAAKELQQAKDMDIAKTGAAEASTNGHSSLASATVATSATSTVHANPRKDTKPRRNKKKKTKREPSLDLIVRGLWFNFDDDDTDDDSGGEFDLLDSARVTSVLKRAYEHLISAYTLENSFGNAIPITRVTFPASVAMKILQDKQLIYDGCAYPVEIPYDAKSEWANQGYEM